MNLPQKFVVGIAAVGEAVGVFFLIVAAYYYGKYVTDTGNQLRHEYMFGVTIALFYGAGALLSASVLAAFLRRALSRRSFRVLAWPGLLAGGVLLAFYLGSLAYEAIS